MKSSAQQEGEMEEGIYETVKVSLNSTIHPPLEKKKAGFEKLHFAASAFCHFSA